MANEDETVWVTFNGEIYNFAELRQRAGGRGHRFRSHTDTEVIVHGYEEWGEAVVERLDGMFAFGVWDARQRRLLLARDRAGKKPLFYGWHARPLPVRVGDQGAVRRRHAARGRSRRRGRAAGLWLRAPAGQPVRGVFPAASRRTADAGSRQTAAAPPGRAATGRSDFAAPARPPPSEAEAAERIRQLLERGRTHGAWWPTSPWARSSRAGSTPPSSSG